MCKFRDNAGMYRVTVSYASAFLSASASMFFFCYWSAVHGSKWKAYIHIIPDKKATLLFALLLWRYFYNSRGL